MTGLTAGLLAATAALFAAVIGFVVARLIGGSEQERIESLEAQLSAERTALENYKREVDAHFDRSASLFVSMAGSYKELFDHLSAGYRKLSSGAERDLFRERVSSLLLEAQSAEEDRDQVRAGQGPAGGTSFTYGADGSADEEPDRGPPADWAPPAEEASAGDEPSGYGPKTAADGPEEEAMQHVPGDAAEAATEAAHERDPAR